MTLATTTGKRQEYGLDSNTPMLKSQTKISDDDRDPALRKCAKEAAKVHNGPCGTCGQSVRHADGCEYAKRYLRRLLDQVFGIKAEGEQL